MDNNEEDREAEEQLKKLEIATGRKTPGLDDDPDKELVDKILYGNKKSDDEEEEDEESEEDDDNSDDDSEEEEPKGRIPNKVYNELRSELRELKKAREDDKHDFETKLSEIQTSRSTAVDKSEQIKQIAREIAGDKATPEEIKSAEFQLEKIAKLVANDNPEASAKLAALEEKFAKIEDKEAFDGEWKGFEKELRKQYPKANQAQLQEAYKAMDDLSHAPQYAEYPLDYIQYKHRDIFAEIFKERKTKTFESRDTYNPQDNSSEEEPEIGKAPIDKLLKLQERLKREAEIEDNRDGWNVIQNGTRM